MPLVFIGIGSNLNQPLKQVAQAIDHLQQLPKTTLSKTSSFYQSNPLGPADQPDFINCVVALDTQLSPQQLLLDLQQIEQKQGRIRQKRWGPRVIDLDILLYGTLNLTTEELTIPHPGLNQREFVLYPLAEIAPDLILPSGETIMMLKKRCVANGIKIIEVKQL